MIRLFKVKEKQKQEAENANARGPLKKQSAGELRLHKGWCLLSMHYIKCLAYLHMFREHMDGMGEPQIFKHNVA